MKHSKPSDANPLFSSDNKEGSFTLDDAVTKGVVRFASDAFNLITVRHKEWWKQFDHDQPVYAISKSAIESLCVGFDSKIEGILSFNSAEAERDFLKVCIGQHSIGYYHGQFVSGTPFFVSGQSTRPNLEGLPNSTQFTDEAIEEANRNSDANKQQFLAYIARLWMSSQFQNELNVFKKRWSKLPNYNRPAFPLNHATFYIMQRDGRTTKESKQFQDEMIEFFFRWCLTGLATWDIPCPQGPVIGNSFPRDSPFFPRSSVTVTIPNYYSLGGQSSLYQQIESLQFQNLSEAGLDPIVGPSGDVRSASWKARIMFLEMAIRQRFPTQQRGGIVTHIECAAAESLGIKIDTVHTYRAEIAEQRKKERTKTTHQSIT